MILIYYNNVTHFPVVWKSSNFQAARKSNEKWLFYVVKTNI